MLSRFRPVIVAELNAVCLARDNRKPEDVLALLRGLGYGCSPFKDGVHAVPQISPAPQPDSHRNAPPAIGASNSSSRTG